MRPPRILSRVPRSLHRSSPLTYPSPRRLIPRYWTLDGLDQNLWIALMADNTTLDTTVPIKYRVIPTEAYGPNDGDLSFSLTLTDTLTQTQTH